MVLGIAGEPFEHPLGDVDGYGVAAGFVARPVGARFGGFATVWNARPVVGEALQTLALARREAADSEAVGDSVYAHGIERVGHSLLRPNAVAAVVVLPANDVFGDADCVGIEHKRQVSSARAAMRGERGRVRLLFDAPVVGVVFEQERRLLVVAVRKRGGERRNVGSGGRGTFAYHESASAAF